MRPFLAGPLGSRILGSVLLIASAGCAYYNTFYLAKKYYREGIKAQERSATDTPSPEAWAKFDLVIRQCTKVLTEYPKSKLADDATYLLSAAQYGKGDYASAIKRLSEFSAAYPKSPYEPDARFMEGMARFRRKEYSHADSIFREVDARYRTFSRRWELYYYEGETQSQLKQYGEAVAWYDRALKTAKSRRERADVLRRTGDAYFQAEKGDTAVLLYAQCLKVEERGKQRLDVALARGDALRELKRYQEELDFLRDWKVFATIESREGEFNLRLYECLALLGRVPEAIEGYRGLVEKFPRTNVAYDAQFRIGYLHESELHDFDGAGREYDKLKSQPQSEFSSQAARRAQNLATLRQYREAIASDTTQARAKAAFLLAELYYFQLDKPDSALAQYRLVEAEYPRSVYAPKSAYARLWIAAYDRKDTLGVMALTDSIVARYRGTRFAESTLYLWRAWSGRTDERTALLDSLLANPDTSTAAPFEPEPELKFPPSPVDTSASNPGQVYAITPAESARIDSSQAFLKKQDEELKAAARGRGAPSRPVLGAEASPDSAEIPELEPTE